MAWYWIILIIVASILALFLTCLLLSRVIKPKFKHRAHKEKKSYSEGGVPIITNPNIGLNLDGKIGNTNYYDEPQIQKNYDDSDIDKDALESYKNYLKDKKKSIIDEIRNLSPELKVLLFDRGLARKDYDFNSKKD